MARRKVKLCVFISLTTVSILAWNYWRLGSTVTAPLSTSSMNLSEYKPFLQQIQKEKSQTGMFPRPVKKKQTSGQAKKGQMIIKSSNTTADFKAKAKGSQKSSTTKAMNSTFETLYWRVQTEDINPDEVKHVVFVKTHKTASSTLQNILIRFSISRQLNIMLPSSGNILSQSSTKLMPLVQHPPSPPFHFDILTNHMVFRDTVVRPWFPNDTLYITILRRSWDQARSAFYYLRNHWRVKYLQKFPNFTAFVQNRSLHERRDPMQSYTNNRMSLDLGLPVEQLKNSSYVASFVSYLNRTFHQVLIAEHFDESLILMKRLFKWTMKDIIYMKLNAFSRSKTKSDIEPDPPLRKAFERYNRFDVAIYDHFLQLHHQKVKAQGPEFSEELQTLKDIEQQIYLLCNTKSISSKMTVLKTRWNKEFTVHKSECTVIRGDEMKIVDDVRKMQISRMERLYSLESLIGSNSTT